MCVASTNCFDVTSIPPPKPTEKSDWNPVPVNSNFKSRTPRFAVLGETDCSVGGCGGLVIVSPLQETSINIAKKIPRNL